MKIWYPWAWRKGPPGPPKYLKQKSYFGFKLYNIASLFDMYIDMGERIAR